MRGPMLQVLLPVLVGGLIAVVGRARWPATVEGGARRSTSSFPGTSHCYGLLRYPQSRTGGASPQKHPSQCHKMSDPPPAKSLVINDFTAPWQSSILSTGTI